MEISLSSFVLFLATLLTGLAAGLCFTWGNAVTPGIGNLNDLGYLQSFQQMNRSILNPIFFIVFFGPFFIALAAAILNKSSSPQIFWIALIATVFYFVGVAIVTIFGNVPLNEMLDKSDLASSSLGELKALREKFEKPWTRLHWIRTISSGISFILLLIATLLK